jgi:hydrogenase nickel incorporation protein HypA/HybF
MRERAVGRELVAALRHAAAEKGLTRVRRARVAVPSRREADLDVVDLWFRATAGGPIGDDVDLHMEERPTVAFCLACAVDVVVRRRADACPRCGGHRLRFGATDDLRVLDCDGE